MPMARTYLWLNPYKIGSQSNSPPVSATEKAAATVIGFLMGLGLKWIVTIGALKLACKYWNSEVPWSGLLIVSVVDVLIRGVIEYIGYHVLELFTLFFFDVAQPMRYLEVRGDAQVDADDDYEFADRVGAKYGGADLRQMDGPGESRVVVTVRPTRVNAIDMAG